MGPVWHGGQAIKGLVLASGLGAAAAKLGWKGAGFNRAAWLATAERAAEFTLRNRETSGPDAGLIHAYENDCCSALTSTQLEGLYGLCSPTRRATAGTRTLPWQRRAGLSRP